MEPQAITQISKRQLEKRTERDTWQMIYLLDCVIKLSNHVKWNSHHRHHYLDVVSISDAYEKHYLSPPTYVSWEDVERHINWSELDAQFKDRNTRNDSR